MKALLILLATVAAFSEFVNAEIEWKLTKGGGGRASIGVRTSHAPSLGNLLKLIGNLDEEDRKSLDQISFMHFFQKDATVQKELLGQFKKDHPDLLRAALASGGNLHNPKVRPLRAVFPEALLETPTVKKIDRALGAVGYKIAEVSFEKFSIDKTKDPVTFFSFVMLKIKPKVA